MNTKRYDYMEENVNQTEKEMAENENQNQMKKAVAENADREQTETIRGLTAQQVAERKEKGLWNKKAESATKTTKEIIKSNVFTYFNLIFLVIALLLVGVGAFRDLTFLPIIVANTLIGIVQEIRSKKVLDDLSILNSPKTRVLRDSSKKEIPAEELVIDDIVELSAGGQIPADAVVLEGQLNVNESLLTGEADEIVKKNGDELLSGSFVVSGRCRARMRRLAMDAALGCTADSLPALPPYLHLLGGKKDALPLLKNCTLPVSHSLARLRGSGGASARMAEAQLAAADFGTLCRVSPEAMGGLLRQKNIFLT